MQIENWTSSTSRLQTMQLNHWRNKLRNIKNFLNQQREWMIKQKLSLHCSRFWKEWMNKKKHLNPSSLIWWISTETKIEYYSWLKANCWWLILKWRYSEVDSLKERTSFIQVGKCKDLNQWNHLTLLKQCLRTSKTWRTTIPIMLKQFSLNEKQSTNNIQKCWLLSNL